MVFQCQVLMGKYKHLGLALAYHKLQASGRLGMDQDVATTNLCMEAALIPLHAILQQHTFGNSRDGGGHPRMCHNNGVVTKEPAGRAFGEVMGSGTGTYGLVAAQVIHPLLLILLVAIYMREPIYTCPCLRLGASPSFCVCAAPLYVGAY